MRGAEMDQTSNGSGGLPLVSRSPTWIPSASRYQRWPDAIRVCLPVISADAFPRDDFREISPLWNYSSPDPEFRSRARPSCPPLDSDVAMSVHTTRPGSSKRPPPVGVGQRDMPGGHGRGGLPAQFHLWRAPLVMRLAGSERLVRPAPGRVSGRGRPGGAGRANRPRTAGGRGRAPRRPGPTSARPPPG
jgi:hypothetical protein